VFIGWAYLAPEVVYITKQTNNFALKSIVDSDGGYTDVGFELLLWQIEG